MWIHPTLQGDVPIRYAEMLAGLKAEWWANGMSPAIAAAQAGGYSIRVHRLDDVPFQRTVKDVGLVGDEGLVIRALEAAAATTPRRKALSKFIDPGDIENARGVRIGSKYAYIHRWPKCALRPQLRREYKAVPQHWGVLCDHFA